MERKDYNVCEPKAPDGIKTRPLLDFGAGYVQRVLDSMPRQGPTRTLGDVDGLFSRYQVIAPWKSG